MLMCTLLILIEQLTSPGFFFRQKFLLYGLERYLDRSKNWGDQDPEQRNALLVEVITYRAMHGIKPYTHSQANKKCQFLQRYEGQWPVEFVMRTRLAHTRTTMKHPRKARRTGRQVTAKKSKAAPECEVKSEDGDEEIEKGKVRTFSSAVEHATQCYDSGRV